MTDQTTAYVVVEEYDDWCQPIAVFLSQEAAEARVAQASTGADHDDWFRRRQQELDRRLAAGVPRGLCFPGPALRAEIEQIIGPEPPGKQDLTIYPVPLEET